MPLEAPVWSATQPKDDLCYHIPPNTVEKSWPSSHIFSFLAQSQHNRCCECFQNVPHAFLFKRERMRQEWGGSIRSWVSGFQTPSKASRNWRSFIHKGLGKQQQAQAEKHPEPFGSCKLWASPELLPIGGDNAELDGLTQFKSDAYIPSQLLKQGWDIIMCTTHAGVKMYVTWQVNSFRPP